MRAARRTAIAPGLPVALVLFLWSPASWSPTPAWAQTPVTALGLGYPVAPVDARAAALGTTGVGLLGGTFSLRNPAELTEHARPGIGIAAAPEGAEVEGTVGGRDTGRSRFNVVRAVFPVGSWALGIGFGSEFDQDWSTRFQDTLEVETGRFPFEEIREQDGGISTIDLSLARRIGPVSLGVGGQRLTGSLRRFLTRRFDADTAQGIQLRPVRDELSLRYRGWRIRAGASARVGERLLVGGAIGWTADLDVEREDPEEDVVVASLDMPTSVEVGASARPVPSLLVTASAGWTGWSSVDGELRDVVAEDTRWGGAGLELTSLSLLGLGLPLRAGFRVADLPFSVPGEEQASEVAGSLGFGLVFRDGDAALDVAFELGSRGDLEENGMGETFRRLTAGFTIRQ